MPNTEQNRKQTPSGDGLPKVESLAKFQAGRPALPKELIQGILRCGQKMILSGDSKAGKSFLMMELAVAIAEGCDWLGFHCRKSRVLYVNLEIAAESAIDRFYHIYEAMGIPPESSSMDNIGLWNLRGCSCSITDLIPGLLQRIMRQHYEVVILDPLYKLLGNAVENSATDVAEFCNKIDFVCRIGGCSIICCHHHSKGAQGAKKVNDRGSGSGVFARDPDAVLDVVRLELTDEVRNSLTNSNVTAWRMESSLREFPDIHPVNFWYEYPIHRVDTTGMLEALGAEGTFKAVRTKNRKFTTASTRKASVDKAFLACSDHQPVTLSAMAKYLNVTERTVRDRIKEQPSVYWVKGGIVGKTDSAGKASAK